MAKYEINIYLINII